jgi:hypothetical protein
MTTEPKKQEASEPFNSQEEMRKLLEQFVRELKPLVLEHQNKSEHIEEDASELFCECSICSNPVNLLSVVKDGTCQACGDPKSTWIVNVSKAMKEV